VTIEIDIRRLSAREPDEIQAYFESGPSEPCVISDAIEHWPAARAWNFDRFARDFFDDFGFISLAMEDGHGGRATKLGTFIANFDQPLHAIPGFWVGPDLAPLRETPDYSEDDVWSFVWRPFKMHPQLLAEISPFPFPDHNYVTALPPDLLGLLQAIVRTELRSIYISRKGSITPLHADFHRTIGSLVQFEGSKQVVLFGPEDYAECDGDPFDPARLDYTRFPEMRERKAFTRILKRSEMLIIPPDWWHYTNALDHSMTLSQNFFNRNNFADFVRGLFSDIGKMETQEQLAGMIAKHLGKARH